MKTIEEKAMFIVNLVNEDLTDYGIKFEAASELMKALINLLKEHEQDTRDSCLRKIEECDVDVSGECIWINDAVNAIRDSEVE